MGEVEETECTANTHITDFTYRVTYCITLSPCPRRSFRTLAILQHQIKRSTDQKLLLFLHTFSYGTTVNKKTPNINLINHKSSFGYIYRGMLPY